MKIIALETELKKSLKAGFLVSVLQEPVFCSKSVARL